MKTQQTKIAAAVASVITEANYTQAQRGEKWLALFSDFYKQGEKFAAMIVRKCKEANLTTFTLADAKSFKAAHIAVHSKGINLDAEGKTMKKLEKAASNAIAWLRRELRTSGVSVEVDARGGANNKTGTNGKVKAITKTATAKGLPKVFEAIALLKQCSDDLTKEEDRRMFIHYLAMIETQERAKTSK